MLERLLERGAHDSDRLLRAAEVAELHASAEGALTGSPRVVAEWTSGLGVERVQDQGWSCCGPGGEVLAGRGSGGERGRAAPTCQDLNCGIGMTRVWFASDGCQNDWDHRLERNCEGR